MKHEISGEASDVALHSLEQHLARHAVENGEVGIEYYALPAQQKDRARDPFFGHQRCVRRVRHWSTRLREARHFRPNARGTGCTNLAPSARFLRPASKVAKCDLRESPLPPFDEPEREVSSSVRAPRFRGSAHQCSAKTLT